jgi:hypothetical protein
VGSKFALDGLSKSIARVDITEKKISGFRPRFKNGRRQIAEHSMYRLQHIENFSGKGLHLSTNCSLSGVEPK